MKHCSGRASIITACIGAGLLSIAPLASAKTVAQHEQKQEHRIQRGVKKGELTKKEASHLQAEEHRIDQERAADMADGNLSKAERREIKQDQHRASKQIHKQRHDEQERNDR